MGFFEVLKKEVRPSFFETEVLAKTEVFVCQALEYFGFTILQFRKYFATKLGRLELVVPSCDRSQL